MKKIITTVGTSLFTNYLKKEKKGDLREWEENAPYSEYSEWEDEIKENEKKNGIKDKLIPFAKKENSCAEITSITKLKEKYGDIKVYLIATDTIESVVVCEILEDILIEKDIEVNFANENIINNLQVNDYIKFKEGLLNLIERLYLISSKYLYENIALNITGGYKALIPYLTIFGQVNSVPLYYIFEHSNNLISIPQAPISINWSLFQKYKNIIDKLVDEVETDNLESYKRENNIEEDFPDIIESIDIDGKQYLTLNTIGRIFYERYKSFIIIEVLKGANFSKENAGNRLEIEKVIQELYKRLQEYIRNNSIINTTDLISSIKRLRDQDDLKHGGNLDKNSFIFKSTNNGQIRLVYSPEIKYNEVFIKIFFYERGSFNHSKYIDDLKNKMKLLTDMESISYPIKK